MASKEFFDHFAVVDLETLAKGSRSAILSMGITLSRYDYKAVTFDELNDNGLYLKFKLEEQLKVMNRTTEKSTVEWWYQQSAEAKQVLKPSPNDVSIRSLTTYMAAFFHKRGVDIRKVDFYDRNSFDMSKLQDVIENNLGEKVPWSYTHVFEISTMLRYQGFDRYAGMRVEDIPGATYHHALHDAAVDHLRIMKALHSINS